MSGLKDSTRRQKNPILTVLRWTCCFIFFFAIFSYAVAPSQIAQEVNGRRYAVGFELTPDYGVAAVHLSGPAYGRTHHISTIQGSETYKDAMRNFSVSEVGCSRSATCNYLQGTILVQGFCRPLPSIAAVMQMIKALKVSAETYIGQEICFATLAIPSSFSTEHSDGLHSAFKAAGLSGATAGPVPADEAIMSNDGSFPPKSEPTVLAIGGGSLLDIGARIFTTESLGLRDGRNRGVFRATDVSSKAQAAWDSATADRLRLIQQWLHEHVRDTVDDVILYGDVAKDPAVEKVLRSILVGDAGTFLWDLRVKDLDPITAVAVGAARRGYDSMSNWSCTGSVEWRCYKRKWWPSLVWTESKWVDHGERFRQYRKAQFIKSILSIPRTIICRLVDCLP